MRFLPRSWPKALLAACALLLACCSLSLEDPEEDARRKLAKLVEPSWELLQGRWVGDSTYTIFDTRAERLAGRLVVDFFPDGSFQAFDSSRLLFAGRRLGSARLAADTLHIDPYASAGSDTLLVRMRFLGNWLELVRSADQRFIHFHKLKPFDSLAQAALLDSSLWLRRFQRVEVDTGRVETLRRDFDYLDFRGDSLRRDIRRDGVAATLAGLLRPSGKLWTWTPAGSPVTLHLDLFHADTLRVWTYHGGEPDSGYSLYTRSRGRHEDDVDMTPLLGHLRTDSIRSVNGTLENHYGRYYDLVLGADHAVRTLTNMAGMPLFQGWTLDTGYLFLEGATAPRVRFQAATAAPKGVVLTADSGMPFPGPATLMLTVVDGSRFEAFPLERFESGSYLHLALGKDTLAYYFLGAFSRGALEEHEISRIDAADTLWTAWRLNPDAETFGSSHPDFYFAFEGRTAALGRFACRSAPSLDLAIRTTLSDPLLIRGLVQGRCRLLEAGTMPPDSTLEITGEFRSRRKSLGLRSPLWGLP